MTANGAMKTSDATKNFNEKLRIYLSFKELNVFFFFCVFFFFFSNLLHLTVSNLIHAGIPVLLP